MVEFDDNLMLRPTSLDLLDINKWLREWNLHINIKLNEISINVGKINLGSKCFTHCRIGHSGMSHKFSILEDPPTSSICKSTLTMKQVLLGSNFIFFTGSFRRD